MKEGRKEYVGNMLHLHHFFPSSKKKIFHHRRMKKKKKKNNFRKNGIILHSFFLSTFILFQCKTRTILKAIRCKFYSKKVSYQEFPSRENEIEDFCFFFFLLPPLSIRAHPLSRTNGSKGHVTPFFSFPPLSFSLFFRNSEEKNAWSE